MTMLTFFLRQLQEEARVTRVMLERVPDDKFDWKPHPKSMSLIKLATHLAELPSWVGLTLDTDDLNFESFAYQPESISQKAELMSYFEKVLADGISRLQNGDETLLSHLWTMRTGDTVHMRLSKADMICHLISQIIHHRAQLGVYLRLLDIPIPGTYGPSADDPSF